MEYVIGYSVGLIVTAAILAFVIPRARAGARLRRSRMAALANALGLAYNPRDSLRLVRTSPQPVLKDTRRRRACNVLRGSYRGRSVCVFDYFYFPRAARARSRWVTAVLVESPIRCATLVVRPVGSIERTELTPELSNLNFESDAFNRQFRVTCPEPKFAYAVLHARALHFLLDRVSMQVEAAGTSVFFSFPPPAPEVGPNQISACLPTAAIRTLLDTACDFMDLLPGYLVADGGARSAPSPQEPTPATRN